MEATICYFIIFVIESLIIWQYASVLFQSRYGRRREALLLICLYAGLYAVSFARLFWLNGTAFLAANFLFITIAYCVSWYSALFHAAIATILMLMGEVLTFSIVLPFLPDFLHNLTNTRDMILHSVLSKTFYFLMLYALSHFFAEKTKNRTHHNKTSLLLSIVPIASAFESITLLYICQSVYLPLFLDRMVSISALLMLSINLLVFAINRKDQKKNAEYMKMQLLLQKEYDITEYHKMLNQQTENQRILIHDIKKHLQSIALLNNNGENEQITSYINHLVHSSDLQESVHICDNDLLNAILCRYKKECLEKGIDFHADIRSGTADFIADNDLTALFCNLLDNAVEAGVLMPEPYIELSLSKLEVTSFTVLTMVNSCQTNPLSGNGTVLATRKPDKLRHGYGMKSVQRMVEKYHGEIKMYYDSETGTFHTIIAFRGETDAICSLQ